MENLLLELCGKTMLNDTSAKWLTKNRMSKVRSRCILRDSFKDAYNSIYDSINDMNPLYTSKLNAVLNKSDRNRNTSEAALTFAVLRGDVIVERDGSYIIYYTKEKYCQPENLTIPIESILVYQKMGE